MTTAPNILVFSGSSRQGSFNTKLAHVASSSIEAAGGKTTFLNLGELDLPLYNGDDEVAQGQPAGAAKLKAMMIEHDGFLIASPEYNGFFTPLLKNAIDWASRKTGDEPPLAAFKGKTAALVAASPGPGGGLRGLPHIRLLLSGIGVVVIPAQFALKSAGQAFDDQGQLTDQSAITSIEGIASQLVDITGKLAA